MSRILCTGCAGFIGSNLANELVKQGHEVIGIDNLSSGNLDNVKNVEVCVRDINEDLTDLFQYGCFDYVFHLAAFINLRKSIENPKECFRTNVQGSINLIDYCIKYKVKCFIFASTGGAIYAQNATLPWKEYSVLDPQSPYGLSKLVIEQYLKMTKHLNGMNFSILRYGNVYGPHQDPQGEAGVISIFLDALLEGKELKMFGTGEQKRDFIYVDDVVQANILMMNDENQNVIYNVGSNSSISVNEVAKELADQLNIVPSFQSLPKIKGEVFETRLSYDLIEDNCGWKPKTSFKEGIRKTIEWRKL